MAEQPVVEFSDENGRGRVRLSYDPMDEDVGTLLVEMRVDGLVCDLPVESEGGDGLHTFLVGLVEDWKGWPGTRHWETLLGELRIEATHRGRRVELLFVLSVPYWGSEPSLPDLEVRLRIEVLPGESLSQLAGAAARLAPAKPFWRRWR
jgi:hypothetical protein